MTEAHVQLLTEPAAPAPDETPPAVQHTEGGADIVFNNARIGMVPR
ncbi:hypothetical protein WN982_35205 [Paraburkholderia sp. IMGN_8]